MECWHKDLQSTQSDEASFPPSVVICSEKDKRVGADPDSHQWQHQFREVTLISLEKEGRGSTAMFQLSLLLL